MKKTKKTLLGIIAAVLCAAIMLPVMVLNTAAADGYTALEVSLCSLVGEEISLTPTSPFDIIVAKDGSGDYTTINEAIDAAKDNGERTVIFVRNGVYEEKVFIGNRYSSSKKVISIIAA